MNYYISKLADSNPKLAEELKNKCYRVVGLCQQVHQEMGPFLNEYMYQEALDVLFEENAIARVKEYYTTLLLFMTNANDTIWTLRLVTCTHSKLSSML